MQVTAAASIGQELALASAKAFGRTERIFDAKTFGPTRGSDTFDRALSTATQQTADRQLYSPSEIKKIAEAKAMTTASQQQVPDATAVAGEPQTAEQVQFTQSDIETLMKIFGTSIGDSNFMAEYDLDGNGSINLQDLNAMLANIAAAEQAVRDPQMAFSQQDLDLLLQAFGAQPGDELYDLALDLDGDGIIGLQDLNLMLANMVQPETPGGFTQNHIDQLMGAFGATSGSENFIAELDLNGDGTLDLSDLNLLLAALSAQNS